MVFSCLKYSIVPIMRDYIAKYCLWKTIFAVCCLNERIPASFKISCSKYPKVKKLLCPDLFVTVTWVYHPPLSPSSHLAHHLYLPSLSLSSLIFFHHLHHHPFRYCRGRPPQSVILGKISSIKSMLHQFTVINKQRRFILSRFRLSSLISLLIFSVHRCFQISEVDRGNKSKVRISCSRELKLKIQFIYTIIFSFPRGIVSEDVVNFSGVEPRGS